MAKESEGIEEIKEFNEETKYIKEFTKVLTSF